MLRKTCVGTLVLALGMHLTTAWHADAATTSSSDIRNTRHNLSGTNELGATVTRAITSGNDLITEAIVAPAVNQTTEICVYCHAPHGASTAVQPLWNRALSSQTYVPYTSTSLQSNPSSSLDDPSKLCLSCHDGTVAIGNVGVLGGNQNQTVTLNNTGSGGTMPLGRGAGDANHGFTRRLGTDLRNDHPISMAFNAALATADGELRTPSLTGTPKIGNRTSSPDKPDLPLSDGKVQCTTCHDPHFAKQKFLRFNRLVQGTGPSSQLLYNDYSFVESTDQICLGCHTRLGKAWAQSAHADPTIANETYLQASAALRDFPTGTTVWQGGCLNCHDTHTVTGSRRLLREGVNTGFSTTSSGEGGVGYVASYRTGANIDGTTAYNTKSAIENTCFQCHTAQNATTGPVAGGSVPIPAAVISATFTGGVTSANVVPDIASEFARVVRMPIRTGDQGTSTMGNTAEVHDITDKDFAESQTQLGYGTPSNRHVECSDCHNPHRVIRSNTFTNANVGTLITADSTKRTHTIVGAPEGNVASGALRGATGIEPIGPNYSGSWPQNPAGWEVKKGDPGAASDFAKSNTYLTREYQLCFKCHSNYANGNLTTDFAQLKASGNTRGGTGSATNGLTRYTNVAAEFLSVNATDTPTSGTDQGEATNAGSACGGDCAPTASPPGGGNNHRSWHPVVWPTGRDKAERGSSSWNNLRAPFFDGPDLAAGSRGLRVGKMTMQCSDCHGSSQSWTQGTSLTSTGGGPDLTKTQGPHGSDNPFLLKGVWNSTVYGNSTAGSNSSGSICGRCHAPTNATSGFAGASEASHGFEGKSGSRSGSNVGNVPCYTCHIVVPHGWKNKAFLVNLNCVGTEGGENPGCTVKGGSTDSGKYTIEPYYYNTVLRIATWQKSGSWTEGSCGAPSYTGKDWMSSACGF